MDVSKEQIEYLAALAKLRFSESEITEISAELLEIIEYFDTLKELDTSGLEPLSHVFPLVNIMREDKVERSFDRDLILKNAPNSGTETFVVPKTVE